MLVTDKGFEAWQWGPTIKDIYFKYHIFGGNKFIIPEEDIELNLKKEEYEIINKIIQNSTKLPPWELVQKIRNPKGAWIKVSKNGEGDKKVIPDCLIEEEALRDD